jgi:hypothetical protein
MTNPTYSDGTPIFPMRAQSTDARQIAEQLTAAANEITEGRGECRKTHDAEQATLVAQGDPDAPMEFGCHIWATESLYESLMRDAAALARLAALGKAHQRAAFEAGFQWCASGTDQFGEYNGGSIEDGYAAYVASLPAPPTATAAPLTPQDQE